jgi:Xaa-Pro aminopeptidase
MIQEAEYKKRRDTLAKNLKNNSVAVLFSADYKTRSNDTEYPFRQNSNFYYLTGFKEDKGCLLFIKKDKRVKTVLFVAKKIKSQELWNGKRVGKKEAKKRFLVDEVLEYETFNSFIKTSLLGMSKLYYDFKLDYSKVKILKRYAKDVRTFKNLAPKIEKMRLIKSASEIALIKKAIAITKEAHHSAMHNARDCTYEYELQADIEHIFKKNGAYSDAYTSIVASANSANTLHYISNDKVLEKDTLVLIDAGCEYEYYASDITRTIPQSGSFTKPQKELYQMVLDVQKELLKLIKPGVKRTTLQTQAIRLLTQGMIDLGILKQSLKKCIKKELYKKYYPHGIGHWMGLDVHDECPYKTKKGKEIVLKEGMILTIEPGIYLELSDTSIPKKYRGIGIRIEDDILITKEGYENLSIGIAKEIKDIESL